MFCKIQSLLGFCCSKKTTAPLIINRQILSNTPVGIIAGSGSLPHRFAQRAAAAGHTVIAVCHIEESDSQIANHAEVVEWIKVGQLGRLIETFKNNDVTQLVMLGGINRIKLFGGVKLDARGAKLLFRLRSGKDDVIMRGIADELENEGITVLPCSTFFEDEMVAQGVISKRHPSKDELEDIEVGRKALIALSSQDIGQLVVVKEGVIVAVEAVEGSDQAIIRGGELGGAGTVVVKCAKTTQDLRFDIPTVGLKTIENLEKSGAKVLAIEAGKTMLLDREEFLALANKVGISVVGINPLS